MNVAIIVAAGRGTRMKDQGAVPKQFRELAGTPLIIHTLRNFERAETIDEVIVVVRDANREEFTRLAASHTLNKVRRVVAGGESRSSSVRCGLAHAIAAHIVAVHDGARPFIASAEIDCVVRAAHETGAAILTVPAIDTIKEVEGDIIVRTPERANLRHALTPQAFRYELLLEAYRAAERDGVLEATDDSTLVERLGVPVRALAGDPRNIKITRPEDWARAEEMMKDGS